MSYTMSCDASLKIKLSSHADRVRYIYHCCRDAFESAYEPLNHSNENIDMSRTRMNATYVYDEKTDRMVYTRDIDHVISTIDNRINDVVNNMSRVRKDTVCIRGLVMQVDPRYFKDITDDRERAKAVQDSTYAMLDWARGYFGNKNVIAAELHNDESNPHVHMQIIPVDDDGCLRQKRWFSGPQAMGFMHKSARQYMRDRGYDISLTNKGNANEKLKRLNEKDMRSIDELRAYIDNLHNREHELDEREQRMNMSYRSRMRDVNVREHELDVREQEMNMSYQSRMRDVDLREHKLDEREQGMNMSYRSRMRDVDVREHELDKREQEINARDQYVNVQAQSLNNQIQSLDAQKRALDERERDIDKMYRETQERLGKARLKTAQDVASHVRTSQDQSATNLHLPRI